MRQSSRALACALLACAWTGCQFASGLDKLHPQPAVSIAGQGDPEPDAPAARASQAAPTSSDAGLGTAKTSSPGSAQPQVDAGASLSTPAADGGGVAGMGGAASPLSPLIGGALGHAAISGVQMIAGGGGMAPEAGSGGMSTVAGDGAAAVACAAVMAGAACGTAPQCGCGANENCAHYGGHLACVPQGSANVNQACNNASDCMRGYQCSFGACLRLCDQTHPDCEAGAMCSAYVDDATRKVVPGVFVCESNCNLAHPELEDETFHACGPGLGCTFTDRGSVCDKRIGRGGTHGQLCEDQAHCARGFDCMSDLVCMKWCASASDCPSGFNCNKNATRRVASTEFGLCAPDCSSYLVCETSPQCGCGSNQTCDVIDNDASQFVHACRSLGSVGPYGFCTANSQCAGGTTCAGGLCRVLCPSAGQTCGERYANCEAVTDGGSTQDPKPAIGGIFSCVRPCDPADPTQAHGIYEPCANGTACEPVEDGRSLCRAVNGSGLTNDTCKYATDCAPHYTCMANGLCKPICRVNGSDCPNGECRSFTNGAFAGDVEWGWCNTSTSN